MASKVFALFVIIGIVALIVTEVAAAPLEGRRCKPGMQYFDGCNTCFCNNNFNVGCTLKLCLSANPEEEVQKLPPPSDFWY